MHDNGYAINTKLSSGSSFKKDRKVYYTFYKN